MGIGAKLRPYGKYKEWEAQKMTVDDKGRKGDHQNMKNSVMGQTKR